MPRKIESRFEQPGIALQNLLEGNAEAAARTILAPDSLSPHEAKTLSERKNIKGVLGGVLDAVTDPLLAFSIITSYKFPVVPVERLQSLAKRFTKDENRIRGLLWWKGRGPSSLFAGTEVPEVMNNIEQSLLGFKDKYIPRFGDAIRTYEKAMGRTISREDGVLLAGYLEKLHEHGPRGFRDLQKSGPVFAKMRDDAPFLQLAKDWRGLMDEAFGDIFSRENLTALHEAAKNTARYQKRHLRDVLTAQGVDKREIDKVFNKTEWGRLLQPGVNVEEYFSRKADYWVHFPARDQSAFFDQLAKEIGATGIGITRPQYASAITSQMLREVLGPAFKRRDKMLPSLADLRLVKDYVNPEAYAAIEGKIRDSAKKFAGREVAPFTEYSLDLMDSTSKYVHQAASTWSWTLKGNGQRLMDMLDKFDDIHDPQFDRMKKSVLENTYIPALMGKMTYDQANRTQAWSNTLQHWYGKLGQWHEKGFIPEGVKNTLQKWMLDDRGNFVTTHWSNSIANYLYVSALGANPAAAARNLFQLVLTTAPTIGTKYTWKGIEESMSRASKYFDMRFGKGMEHGEAMQEAFGEFVKSGLPAAPITDEAVGRLLNQTFNTSRNTLTDTVSKGADAAAKAKRAMMLLFGSTEKANRMVTFHGTLRKFLDEGAAGGKKAADIMDEGILRARQVVQDTQFTAGVANTPYALVGRSRLATQFMQFPLKFLEYATSTAWRLGSGGPEMKLADLFSAKRFTEGGSVFGVNPGIFSRMYMYSDIAGRLGMEMFGTDLDQSLLTGAVPTPNDRGPFAPIPFMPPAMSILGAPLLDIAKGNVDFQETRHILPLLVPGGIGLSRSVGAIPGGEAAAKFLDRKYVDYNAPSPEGTYPVFTGKGNLLGYMNVGQLFGMATGLGERGAAVQTEEEMYKFLTANRDRLRGYVKDFVQSTVNGDVAGSNAIATEYNRAFPGADIRKLVKKDHFAAERRRRELTRLERLLDTMPAPMRQEYAQALQTAMAGLGPELHMLGLMGEGLESGQTAKQRNPMRVPMQPATSNARGGEPGGGQGGRFGGGFSDFAAFDAAGF